MSVQIAVIDDWQHVASGVADWSALEALGEVHFLHDYPADTAVMIERLQGFEVICVMRERSTFDKALLQGLPTLKLLVTGGMRNAAIDIPAAKTLGITVCGTDSYKQAAPELTWALIMASTRNLLAEANSLRAGGWQVGLGGDLYGKTLGILGLGSIGQKVAQFAQVFGMRVIAWSENLTPERAAESGCDLGQQTGAVRTGRHFDRAPGTQRTQPGPGGCPSAGLDETQRSLGEYRPWADRG